MTNSPFRAFAPIALIAAATTIVFPGCDSGPALPPRAKVKGRVTLDGKALPTGMVTFVPDTSRGTSGPPAVGGIDSTGHYVLSTDRQSDGDGAVVGFHQVRVIANEPAKDAMQSMTKFRVPLRIRPKLDPAAIPVIVRAGTNGWKA